MQIYFPSKYKRQKRELRTPCVRVWGHRLKPLNTLMSKKGAGTFFRNYEIYYFRYSVIFCVHVHVCTCCIKNAIDAKRYNFYDIRTLLNSQRISYTKKGWYTIIYYARLRTIGTSYEEIWRRYGSREPLTEWEIQKGYVREGVQIIIIIAMSFHILL